MEHSNQIDSRLYVIMILHLCDVMTTLTDSPASTSTYDDGNNNNNKQQQQQQQQQRLIQYQCET
jgi:hypothetical protein